METQQAVLVIDDGRNICRILEEKLRKSGFAVAIAHDAASGARRLLQHPFDLVLLDVRLPDADGIAVLSRLRALAPHTAFVVMTAYEEERTRARALAAGAVDALYKPLDLDSLIQTIHLHIAENRLHAHPEPGAIIRAVVLDQAVVVATEAGEYPARITATHADTFDVVPDRGAPGAPTGAVSVRVAGDDGLYYFRTHVVATGEKPGGGLSLAKPVVIHRRQRRRHPRVLLNLPVRVGVLSPNPPLLDEPLTGMARDVSLGGMALVVPHRLLPGVLVHLAWTLPLLPPPSGEVRMKGDVVRTEEIGEHDETFAYRVAVRFRRAAPEDRARLRAFIAQNSRN